MKTNVKMISLDMKNQPALNASNHPSLMIQALLLAMMIMKLNNINMQINLIMKMTTNMNTMHMNMNMKMNMSMKTNVTNHHA